VPAGSPIGLGVSVPFSHVDFAVATPVTVGEQLALLFFAEGAKGPNILTDHGPGVLYAGGQGVIFALGAWHPSVQFFDPGLSGSDDFAFQTFVETSPVPEPTSILLFGTGLGVLTRLRRKKLSETLPPRKCETQIGGAREDGGPEMT
jgi:hypothetical protein